MSHIKSFYLVFFLSISQFCYSQSSPASAERYLIDSAGLKADIIKLTDSLAEGRATGSAGSAYARNYITQKLESYDIEPLGINYEQVFKCGPFTAHNITGIIRSNTGSNKYVIIGAHYDHLGVIKDRTYPGADDNASGTAMLLDLSRLFSKAAAEKRRLGKNIIIIFFDANELSMSGSRYFIDNTDIPWSQFSFMVNLDQIGSSLVPPGGNKNYLLVLGSDRIPEWADEQLSLCLETGKTGLDLDKTFYGSKRFCKLFYMLSDQYTFAGAGIPALLFTSGINKNTNKQTDTEKTIDYKAMIKREKFIYDFLCQIIN
ncbi:MAG: M28 family peptidase [Bacteroidales bacterium]|jgi:Zn-dependent M28 family amino/carboxypeptidase|nr:M28 family peptidase [Bacteroidales bacterium]